MDRIVIVVNQHEPDFGLLVLLNALFPDCQIDLVHRNLDSCPPAIVPSEGAFSETLDGGGHDSKDPNC